RPPARRRSHAAAGSRVFVGGLAASATIGLAGMMAGGAAKSAPAATGLRVVPTHTSVGRVLQVASAAGAQRRALAQRGAAPVVVPPTSRAVHAAPVPQHVRYTAPVASVSAHPAATRPAPPVTSP